MPSLATEWNPELIWQDEELERTHQHMPEPTVLCYLSGRGPNQGFHQGWWTPEMWARLILFLNHAGVVPIAVGAKTDDDLGYWRDCFVEFRRFGAKIKGLVGYTSIPDYLLLIQRAACWVGLNSGGGIVSASMGSPTLMFWSDNRFPVSQSHVNFEPGFKRSWIDDEGDPSKAQTYRTMCYGSPELTPQAAAECILEIMR